MKQNVTIEIKGLTDEGYFEGMLSPYGNVDQGGDVVERGAYTKTIQDQGSTRPLLWQHKSDCPIGQIELVDTPEGLTVKGQLLMDLPEAKKAHLLMKARIVKGLSIGFSTVKDSIENGVRRLKELKLFEGSVVTFPMNSAALITSVKGHETKGDFNQELLDVQLQDAAYQMRQALWRALDSAVWDGMTRAEILTATEATLDQFRVAYMAFLPNYLDMLNREFGPSDRWKSNPAMETKAGRKISAATRSVIESAITSLNALLADEAGAEEDSAATTSSKEAAKQETKSEPVGDDHSAITPLIAELKGAFQWNL